MIRVGIRKLTPEDFYEVLFVGEKIELDPKSKEKVRVNFEFLQEFSDAYPLRGNVENL